MESSSELYVPDSTLAVVEPGFEPQGLRPVTYRHGHPFMGGWSPGRLDMGYDGTFGKHIWTPVDGEVIFAGLFNGWMGSHGVIIRSDHDLGEDVPTNCIYFVEGLMPMVRAGERVELGKQIAYAVPNPYNGIIGNIEWGVVQHGPVGQQTNAYAMALGTGSSASKEMVLRFNNEWCVKVIGMHGSNDTGNAGSP